MANYNSFDDWKSYMQTVVKENGVGAITGPLLQTVLGELSDTAEWLVSTSGSSADARALAAEGWAVGTQRGVPVTEGSPYYQNNSLYWAEVVNGIAGSLSDVVREARAAAGTAESAAAGANAAAEGATSAAESASSAAVDAQGAANAANNAAAAATTAKEGAESAASAATAAGDYARGEIDGAKGDYDSLADRFQHVDETAMYWQETGLSADPDLIDEYDRVLRLAYQCITDMQGATATTERATTDATTAAQAARANADYAEQVARQAQTVVNQAGAVIDEGGQVINDARTAAVEANQYASQARQAATLANEKSAEAAASASLADEKSAEAAAAASLATEKAAYAEQKGNYAQSQIDGAKGEYDSLAARFQHVDETAMYWQETGLSSDPDLEDEYRRVLRVAYQMLTDMQAATEDTKAKTALAAAAAELCNARSVECAEKTALANTAAAYATAQGNYAKQKADEIDLARGEYQTLSDRLDAMQRQLEAALYFQAVNN